MRLFSFWEGMINTMPKVSQDYIDNKKKQIIDAALVIFKKKPLYEMTMLDVIKEAGLSKGGIYRYYNDIDEVIVALVNRETAQNNYKYRIDEILKKSENSKSTIESLFAFLGEYIKNNSTSIGKIQFELTVLIANHPEKEEKIIGSLTEQENGQFLIKAIFNKIIEGINNGEFKPIFPCNDIFAYITTSIDGLIRDVVLGKCYGANVGIIDEIKIMRMLAHSVLYMLGKR